MSPEPFEPPDPEPERITVWHPMLVTVLETYLPSGWHLIPELLLARLSQRADIVIVERTGEARGEPAQLRTIFDYLCPHTLIEHKGATDDLAAEDALVLLGYGAQYMRLKKIRDPATLCLMVVADRISPAFVAQVKRLRGSFARASKGVWRGKLAGATLHGVETKDAPRKGPTERLLYAFSRAFLKDPRGGPPLDEEARRVYALLVDQVEQFRKSRGPAEMKHYELMKKSLDELMEPVLDSMPAQKRLRGLTPEQRLEGLTPEQRLDGLAPDELAKAIGGLAPDELAKAMEALPPTVRKRLKRHLH